MNKVLFSSLSDDWFTPMDLFNSLNDEFSFNLDPCADFFNHKCSCYFTKEMDGLSRDWYGSVFVNPPYSRNIGKWVRKAYFERTNCNVIVMLLPARTDTSWFHDYIYNQAEIRFLRGRLKFGSAVHIAPFPSMVVIFYGG